MFFIDMNYNMSKRFCSKIELFALTFSQIIRKIFSKYMDTVTPTVREKNS